MQSDSSVNANQKPRRNRYLEQASQMSTLVCATLQWISPNDRDTPRIPLTRPRDTNPPAASTRAASDGTEGVWSRVIATALPPLQSTARQSPTFATCRNTGSCCWRLFREERREEEETEEEEHCLRCGGFFSCSGGGTSPAVVTGGAGGRWTIAITATAPENACSVVCFFSELAAKVDFSTT